MAEPAKPPDGSETDDSGLSSGMSAEDRTAVVLRGGGPAPTPASGDRFVPGDLLAGRFRIIRFLGQGGMGDVYEAEDEKVHGRVALKTLRPEIAKMPGALERFTREIHLARKVTHSNVCRLYDIAQHGEVTFLAMEMLLGETLDQRLRREGAFREEAALPLVQQMAEGLAAAHRAGVVHRDFKPSNVMLVPEDGGTRVVVTDFGLAHGAGPAGDGITVRGDILGTPSYMAPEQVAGEEVTPATDIYAFGITLYEMMTGTLPFVGETALSTAVKRLKQDPPPPHLKAPGLDPRWEAAILRCLAREPGKRFADIREAVAALEPEAALVSPGPRRRKRRLLVAVAASFAILLVIAAGWWSWYRPKAEVEALLARAQDLKENGKFAEAAKALEQARTVLARIGDHDREHQALGSQGLALGNNGSIEQGVPLIKQALDYFEATKNKDGQANQLINLGTLYQNTSDLDQARKYLVRGLAMAEAAGNPSLEALAAFDLGTVFYYQGDLQGAQEKLRKALEIRQGLGETESVIESEIYMGEILLEQGLTEEAVKYARKAVADSRSIGKAGSEAEAGALLARIRLKQSNLPEARSELDAVERIAEMTQDSWIRGVVALAAGYVLAAEKKTEQAVRRLEAALQEASGLDLELRLALGEIEAARGNRQRSRELLQPVKTEAERLGLSLIADKAARAMPPPE